MEVAVVEVKVVVYPHGRLDTENASRFLGLSPKTLAIMRSNGTGPCFVKRGRVFYFLEDLQAWFAEQPRVRSSAQARFIGLGQSHGASVHQRRECRDHRNSIEAKKAARGVR